jgi:HEAT repeat protein
MLRTMSDMERAAVAVVLATILTTGHAAAQSLAARVDAAPPGYVQFSFAARPGVCGNGTSYIRAGSNTVISGSINISDTHGPELCEPGPVRVVIDRAERQIIAVRTYVGPDVATRAGTDLGRVPPQQAADYLLDLAARSEGRVGRDALFSASLADSVDIMEGLVTIARNQALSRETRTSALSYLGRTSEQVQTVPRRVLETLLAVARDESDNLAVRRQALSVLGRLEHGAGIATLIDLAEQNTGLWLAREATTVLGRSGDPRARAQLRTMVQHEDTNEAVRAIALRALGREYATQQDAALLRSIYPRLASDEARTSAIAAVADVGGAENLRWLIALVKNAEEPIALRRRALESATRAGGSLAELVAMYAGTTDQQLKEALVTAYARSTEPIATEALMTIARNETNVNIRRRAINALSKSNDPKVKELLADLVVR